MAAAAGARAGRQLNDARATRFTQDRRRFLQSMGLGMSALMSPWPVWGRSPRNRPPNVLIIYTDDQGTLDAGCYGAEDLYTPHIDGLAKQGVRFTQAYSHTVCCPARAALLTGRAPQRCNVNSWTSVHPSDENETNMFRDEVTLAEALKARGYRTGLVGKWHLGAAPGHRPNDQGFDEFFGFLGGFIDNYSHEFLHSRPGKPPFHDLWHDDTEVFRDGEFFPDLCANAASTFLEDHAADPFLLYLAFNVPHYPEQPDPRFEAMYDNLDMPRRSYAAWVSTLDDRIGRVLNTLDRAGLRDDTIILFMSDNGHSTEDYSNWDTNYGSHGGGGYTGKWRGAKGSFLEGGIRVPCILSCPDRIPAGEVRDQAVMSTDFFPTMLEACGVPPPADRAIDGKSLWPILESADAPENHEVMHWQWQQRWAVREGPWKLIGNGRDTTGEFSPHPRREGELPDPFLGNLSESRPEWKDHAEERPDIVRRLTRLHDQWHRQVMPAG